MYLRFDSCLQNIIWNVWEIHWGRDHGLLSLCVHRLHLGNDWPLASHGW